MLKVCTSKVQNMAKWTTVAQSWKEPTWIAQTGYRHTKCPDIGKQWTMGLDLAIAHLASQHLLSTHSTSVARPGGTRIRYSSCWRSSPSRWGARPLQSGKKQHGRTEREGGTSWGGYHLTHPPGGMKASWSWWPLSSISMPHTGAWGWEPKNALWSPLLFYWRQNTPILS